MGTRWPGRWPNAGFWRRWSPTCIGLRTVRWRIVSRRAFPDSRPTRYGNDGRIRQHPDEFPCAGLAVCTRSQ